VHFLQFGFREGADPHPLFDIGFYGGQAGELGEIGVNPLVHFLRWGHRDGLRPNPWFDPKWYVQRNPDVADANPLIHFVQRRWRENRDPSPEFSLSDYVARNPDVAASGLNPLEHFIRSGRARS